MCFCLCWQNSFTYKGLPRKKTIFGWIIVEKTIAGSQENKAVNTVEPKAHHHGTAAARQHSKGHLRVERKMDKRS